MEQSEILKLIIQLLGQLGIFGIVGYFIQKQIDNASQKRLEEFKLTLSLISNKGIKLHEKRLWVIENIYSKLVDLETSMLWLTSPLKFIPNEKLDSENTLLGDAAENFSSFAVFFEKNKIYFSEKLCCDLERIRNTFNDAMWNYNEHKLFKKEEVDKETFISARKKMIDAYTTVKDTIPTLRKSLEAEFRKILAVD